MVELYNFLSQVSLSFLTGIFSSMLVSLVSFIFIKQKERFKSQKHYPPIPIPLDTKDREPAKSKRFKELSKGKPRKKWFSLSNLTLFVGLIAGIIGIIIGVIQIGIFFGFWPEKL